MTKYSKFNPIYRLQKWLDSVPGQTFMNYAYSWGASIVILGALFKLTHLPGANTMLFLGMGTEVLVFFIAGFDRPFDKTEEGKELPTHVVDVENPEGTTEGTAAPAVASGGTIIIGGGGSAEGAGGEGCSVEGEGAGSGIAGGGGVISGGGFIGGGGYVGGGYGGGAVAGEGDAAAEGITVGEGGSAIPVSGGIISGGIIGGVAAQQQPELPDIDPAEMEEATQNYVEQLKSLTETLKKVSEQSERLTRDSEEMENLNRTLTGICKVYEMQLKGASQQIGTIDQINEQSRRMADQIAELNKIYTRMIEAMTVNMKAVNS
ncbi:MAG: gliding motility protein GldL [Prevotella sp.]|nr:gliding motility protein GldL [Prevotella sp.]